MTNDEEQKRIEATIERLFGPNAHYDLPAGAPYLNEVFRDRTECEKKTKESVGDWEIKAADSLRYIGAVLPLLRGMAICERGCGHSFHVVERIAGRIVSTSNAALLLMAGGYYDEAIALNRSTGETGNLLSLFLFDRQAFEDWLTASASVTKTRYSPYNVRTKLEKLGQYAVIGRERYRALSEVATHVTPHQRVQSYNQFGLQTLGGFFQPDGVRVVATEMALAIAHASVCVARLRVSVGNMDEEAALNTFRAAWLLLESIDEDVSILQVRAHWETRANSPDGQRLLKLMQQADRELEQNGSLAAAHPAEEEVNDGEA